MRATIAYYDPPRRPAADERPDSYTLPLTSKPVTVSSMRAQTSGFSLDQEGFTLVEAPTSVHDFYDGDEVSNRYVPEALELVRSLTTCAVTTLFSRPAVRISGRVSSRPAGSRYPGDYAHADFSARTAESILRGNVPADEVAERLGRRYAVFNVWRAFSGPPQDVPLALCDARSVRPEDKQPTAISMTSSNGDLQSWENVTYYHNAAHRWWYCSDMTRDEAYVFRAFDSSPTHAEQVPHSAFINDRCPVAAPPRASVEIRVFAFYGE